MNHQITLEELGIIPKSICAGGYTFYGCYCKPYTGKRVAEIKDCPKEDKYCGKLESEAQRNV